MGRLGKIPARWRRLCPKLLWERFLTAITARPPQPVVDATRESASETPATILFMSAQPLNPAAGIYLANPGFRWAPSLNGCADLNCAKPREQNRGIRHGCNRPILHDSTIGPDVEESVLVERGDGACAGSRFALLRTTFRKDQPPVTVRLGGEDVEFPVNRETRPADAAIALRARFRLARQAIPQPIADAQLVSR